MSDPYYEVDDRLIMLAADDYHDFDYLYTRVLSTIFGVEFNHVEISDELLYEKGIASDLQEVYRPVARFYLAIFYPKGTRKPALTKQIALKTLDFWEIVD